MAGAEVGTNLIDGHPGRVLVFLLQMGGAEVGTNLIDGHYLIASVAKSPVRRRGWHQPDRRTLMGLLADKPPQAGAEVGTNLIDGHSGGRYSTNCRCTGAEVGTNLIDGHRR